MASKRRILADSLFSLVILAAAFLVNLLLVQRFDTKSMTPMIFVLGAGNPFLMYTIIVWASVLISAYILVWLLFGV